MVQLEKILDGIYVTAATRQIQIPLGDIISNCGQVKLNSLGNPGYERVAAWFVELAKKHKRGWVAVTMEYLRDELWGYPLAELRECTILAGYTRQDIWQIVDEMVSRRYLRRFEIQSNGNSYLNTIIIEPTDEMAQKIYEAQQQK